MAKITNQQEWGTAMTQVVELLAECNKFAIADQRQYFPDNYKGLEQDLARLAGFCSDSADACGLFEMVAEKIQES